MKNDWILCVVTFLVLVSILVYAEFGASTPTVSTSQGATLETAETTIAAETEIRRILENYYELARTGDRAALKNYSREITAPEYTYSSENGVTDKKATLRLLESLQVEYVSTAFDDLTVQVHGDTAIAKYRDVSEIRTGKETQKKQRRFTNVWVKQNGAWKIVAEHSSVLAPAKLLPRHPLADKLM